MWTLVLAVTILSAAPDVEAQAMDGVKTSGQLVELTADLVTIETTAGLVKLEVGKLSYVKPRVAPPAVKATSIGRIQLVDRSVLAISAFTAHGGQAKVTLAGGYQLE